MKRYLLMMCAGLVVAACGNDTEDVGGEGKVITFYAAGGEWVETRATAIGETQLTHLWVFDYLDGVLMQQVAQVSTDEDFGVVTLPLRYGRHEVCFVASAGLEPSLNVDLNEISWGKVRDTFWTAEVVTVGEATGDAMTVTLGRVASKVRLKPTDAVPEDAVRLEYTMSRAFKTLDWLTGDVSGETAVSSSANIASYAGTSDALSLTLWSLGTADEWTSDFTLSVKDGSGTTVGTASVTGVPLKAGHSVEYTGRLFGKTTTAGVLVNEEWSETVTGTW